MKYTVVNFVSNNIKDWQQDLLIAELGGIGFDTFEENDQGFAAYIPTANFVLNSLETLLYNQVDGYHVDYEVKDVDEENWNILWESNFNPIVVDDQVYVRATFHEAKPQYRYEIIIDPKMSFGTGHHQTTSMMLSFILANEFANKRVLDMGCGTGILAILASKHGASHVVAVDYDPVCVESVLENSALNAIHNITALLGSVEVIDGDSFDIILANINRNILLEQLEFYTKVLKTKGQLYVSGFYMEGDLNEISIKCQSLGLSLIMHKLKDDWCAAMFLKH